MVKEKFRARYARIQKCQDDVPKNDRGKGMIAFVASAIQDMREDEMALFTKQFKGLCRKCSGYGHNQCYQTSCSADRR